MASSSSRNCAVRALGRSLRGVGALSQRMCLLVVEKAEFDFALRAMMIAVRRSRKRFGGVLLLLRRNLYGLGVLSVTLEVLRKRR